MTVHGNSSASQKEKWSTRSQHKFAVVVPVFLLLLLQCCVFIKSESQSATQVPSSTPETSQTLTSSQVETKISTPPEPSPVVSTKEVESTDLSIIRQGATFGVLDPDQIEDVVIGNYNPEFPSCGDGWLATLPGGNRETILTLNYLTPVLPLQISIYSQSGLSGIKRIELMNSQSGLGTQVEIGSINASDIELNHGACTHQVNFAVSSEFEVDMIIIEFENIATVAEIAAVELFGRLDAYTEPSVYWRVPLPGTPSDIAMGNNGLVYVISEGNMLDTFDVEGNHLNNISTPGEANLLSLEVELSGNVIVTDTTLRRFIVLSPSGVQQVAGGEGFYTELAVNPQDGNVYLLNGDTVEIYTADTAEFQRSFQFNDSSIYTCMAFDPQGQLYIMRDFNWAATLMTVDPFSGEESAAFPLVLSSMVETVASDMDVDETGKIYLLFSMNTGNIAIHQLSESGVLMQRFGRLTSDSGDWPEGSFLDPRAIAVSPDGRFLLVADGYDENAYLTAFLMEIDE